MFGPRIDDKKLVTAAATNNVDSFQPIQIWLQSLTFPQDKALQKETISCIFHFILLVQKANECIIPFTIPQNEINWVFAYVVISRKSDIQTTLNQIVFTAILR